MESSRTSFNLKSLALATKVNSLALASKPQVLKNWNVLGSRTALFLELFKACGASEKFFGKRFFSADRLKNFSEDLFFWREFALVSLVLGLGLEHSSPWPREVLSSVGLSLVFALASDFLCPWPWRRALEPCVLDSTSDFNHRSILCCLSARTEKQYQQPNTYYHNSIFVIFFSN